MFSFIKDAPFQAPQSEIDKFPNIRDTERQTYAGRYFGKKIVR